MITFRLQSFKIWQEVIRVTESKRPKLIRNLGYNLIFIIVIYTLSFGPVIALFSGVNGHITNPYVEGILIKIYTPLIYVAKSNTVLESIIGGYLELCCKGFIR